VARSRKLAPLTGKNPVPQIKSKQFRFEKDKFGVSGLTPIASEIVQPARAEPMPVHMEARVTKLHRMGGEKLQQLGGGLAAEVEIVRVHVAADLVVGDSYIDPSKWSPLIYNFGTIPLGGQRTGKDFPRRKIMRIRHPLLHRYI